MLLVYKFQTIYYVLINILINKYVMSLCLTFAEEKVPSLR